MYLIYVDESGTIDIQDSENFVLAGLIINEAGWFEADKKVKDLKNKYFPNNLGSIEIHMSEIVNGNNNFHQMSREQRAGLINDIFEMIKTLDIRIVYSVVKKKKLLTNLHIRNWSYKILFERLCYQLNDLNTTKGTIQYGLLLLDSICKKRDAEIWGGVTDLLKDGSGYEENKFLIEGPVFVESHLRSPMQIIDCIAYVINYHYKENKREDEINNALENAFSIIDSKIFTARRYARKVFPE
jgi:hypothetical protein